MPPSASWNLPMRLSTAPVKEPFSWPNRMLSTRFSGMAPQLTVMKGLALRSLSPWMARAISSLPTPDFALDQDGDVGCGGAAAERYRAMHGLATDDEVGKGERALGLLLDAGDLALQRLDLERAVDRHLEPLGRGRLDDEVDRAGAHGRDGGIDGAVRCLHDDRRGAGLGGKPLQHLDAVHAGHDEIEQDEGDGAAIRPLEDLQGLLAALGRLGLEAETLNGFFEDATLGRIVVDDQDELWHIGCYSTQLATTRTEPTWPKWPKIERTATFGLRGCAKSAR